MRDDDSFEARAAARKSWPVRAFRLGAEPCDDLSGSTTAAERLEMMWPLALEAWNLTRQPIPEYARNQTPIRALPSGVTSVRPKRSEPL